MRRAIVLLLLVATLAVGVYAVSPLLAAWDLYSAVQSGDRATLERRVDWPSVRRALKQSTTESQQVIVEIAEASGEGGPGLWQRIKSAAVPRLADPFIDRYVTPDGAPRLWRWRQTWRQRVRPALGLDDPVSALAGTWLAGTAVDKAWTVWRRVEHARFDSPTRLSLEIRDRVVETRRWRAALALDNWTWRLTAIEVVRVAPPPGSPAPGARSEGPLPEKR